MPSSIQIGSILVSSQLPMTERFGLESDSYWRNWSAIRGVNGFSLDRTVLASGWHSFFMAPEVSSECFRIHPGGQCARRLAAYFPEGAR
jgi:hypothetical protein